MKKPFRFLFMKTFENKRAGITDSQNQAGDYSELVSVYILVTFDLRAFMMTVACMYCICLNIVFIRLSARIDSFSSCLFTA